MRDPLGRFLSLFNFRGELKKKYKTPQSLVAAIRVGKLPQDDARPFCNQMAWLLSGKDVDYTTIADEHEAGRVAGEVIKEANKRNVTVLMTERMSESVAVLAHLMNWKVDDLQLRVASQRVQSRAKGRSVAGRQSSCHADGSDDCSRDIRECNLVDQQLYTHYQRVFDDLVQQLPPPTSGLGTINTGNSVPADILDRMPKAQASMSRLELGTFPVSCVPSYGQGEDQAAHGNVYKRLHSCGGRPS
ncbi:unnamed protein product [Laminaria digitata]